MSRKRLYDEMCRVLTDYEDPATEEERTTEKDLYDMLSKIAGEWEYITGE
jgi:hypothetical protein